MATAAGTTKSVRKRTSRIRVTSTAINSIIIFDDYTIVDDIFQDDTIAAPVAIETVEPTSTLIIENSGGFFLLDTTFFIIVGCAAALVVIMAITLFCICRKKKSANGPHFGTTSVKDSTTQLLPTAMLQTATASMTGPITEKTASVIIGDVAYTVPEDVVLRAYRRPKRTGTNDSTNYNQTTLVASSIGNP